MKNISTLSTILFIVLANICSAQVSDDFNDGEFSNWSGTTSHFIINSSHMLQLNNTVASTSYLATTFAPSTQDIEWNVYVRQAFAGSANNYGRIYLLSSNENLTQSTEGYYLQLGEAGSNDAVELFRQDGNTSVSVCRAANATIASSFAIRIKVVRDSSGLWKVLIDYNGGTDFMEAATGTDLTYSAGGWIGFVCQYTVGNATRFYYDDVYAGPVKLPPPPPDVAEANDVVINEFFPDPTPPVGLPEQEFVEIYNKSSKTFDLQKWKIGDATSLVSMPSVIIHPDEYVVITSSNGLPSLNNGGDAIRIVDDHGLLIDSINYSLTWYQDTSKSGGGYSIERLNPDVSSNELTNWYVSQDSTGGTPGKKNSVFGRNPDSKSATIVYIRYMTDSIVVKFSEPVQPFSVDAFVTKLRADTTAVIYLENLTNGVSYKIAISNVRDLAGNNTETREFSFTYFIAHPVNYKDIIITEIMADPTPVVQMPEAEYIEILNRSIHPIDLTGWRLEDPTTIGKIPSTIIMPGSYLLLTSTTNVQRFPKSAGVTSFPSLGNLGDRIVLRSASGIAIDSVSYDLSWYRSTEKRDGGWSLELIDINNPCGEEDNWTSSEDIDGGTPGEINSVFANKPDVTPPDVLSVNLVTADTLLVTFNEKLKDAGKVSVNSKAILGNRTVTYVFTEPLQTRVLYSITLSDVTDCNGNRIDDKTLTFALTEQAAPNDIVINEILFNPRPGESDFVELYNRTVKYINLRSWTLSGKIISNADDIMTPGSYRVLNSSTMSMPSMPDDEGTVVLADAAHVVIDSVYYNDRMHSPILQDTEGVSLERISPGSNEWHSANASAGYSTPGAPNSSVRSTTNMDNTIEVEPRVIHPSGMFPFSQIFYRFEQAGMIANVSVIDMDGRVIKTIAANETLAVEGTFQWDGDRNEGGMARVGYYMLWFQVFDLSGQVTTYRQRIVVGL